MCALTALGSDVIVGGGWARNESKPRVLCSPARSGSARCTVGDCNACSMLALSRDVLEETFMLTKDSRSLLASGSGL
jgi:hypothetical protein